MVDIVLIEDDRPLAETTLQYLKQFGFEVRHAADGELGLKAVATQPPDLILLDLMLPGVDGLEVCRRLRMQPHSAQIPILMLTARGEEVDRVAGLELGADDYMPKPYSLRELVARIRAILRRSTSPGNAQVVSVPSRTEPPSMAPTSSDEILEVGDLRINRLSRDVVWQEQPIELTATEFELLWLLASRSGQVLTREQLLDQVRGREFEVFDRSIDVHISKLRKKLEKNPKQPRLIRTIWGVGYRMELKPDLSQEADWDEDSEP